MKSIKYFLGLIAVALLAFACSEAEAPVTPPTPGGGSGGDTNVYQGKGTKEEPYTVADVIKMNPSSTTESKHAGVWAEGYIVGFYDNKSNPSVLSTTPDSITVNILIADAAEGATLTNTACIQLPAGEIRTALDIYTNASNIGRQVKVYGDVLKYNTLPGVKNVSGYWFVDTNTGVNPPEAESFDVPEMTFAELYALYQGATVKLTEKKKVVAVVTSDVDGGNSTSLKNLVVTNVSNTAGISIRFSDKDNTYKMNTKVEILLDGATLQKYNEAMQLEVSSIRVQSVGTASITPNVLTLAQINSDFDTYAFTVVTTTGSIAEAGSTWVVADKHTNNTLSDNDQSITLFVSKYAAFKSSVIPAGTVDVTGILQQFGTTKQLIIRNLGDVVTD